LARLAKHDSIVFDSWPEMLGQLSAAWGKHVFHFALFMLFCCSHASRDDVKVHQHEYSKRTCTRTSNFVVTDLVDESDSDCQKRWLILAVGLDPGNQKWKPDFAPNFF